MTPRVAVFAPNPLLTIVVERTASGADDVHLHAGGQGVWVARMAAELGAVPVLCGLAGGETGAVLADRLAGLPLQRRLVETAGTSGCYVMDRRSGERRLVAMTEAPPPTRHELDDLLATAIAAAADCGLLVVCNPFPAETLPLEVYGALVEDSRAVGARVVVDLSPPRLDAALPGRPDLVKLNDWELAQYVRGPVDPPERLGAAAERLLAAGAQSVIVTRGGEPATWFDGTGRWRVTPPSFPRGRREGCGDAMTGAIAARLAAGDAMLTAITAGAAAGAANFLRHGLGTGDRELIERLAARVRVQPAA